MSKHRERTFEDEIIARLTTHGWLRGSSVSCTESQCRFLHGVYPAPRQAVPELAEGREPRSRRSRNDIEVHGTPVFIPTPNEQSTLRIQTQLLLPGGESHQAVCAEVLR